MENRQINRLAHPNSLRDSFDLQLWLDERIIF